MGPGDSCNLFGRAFRNNQAAAITAFRAKIDDPVRRLDDIHIMFNHNHCIAGVDQFLQHFQQFGDIVKMQAGCRLIKDIDGPACGAP